MKLGILASGTGTNFQSILDACADGSLAAEVVVAISNNSSAMALQRARDAGVPAYHLSGKTHPDPDALDGAILAALESNGAELIVLVGYMKHLGPATLARYRGRAVNIHPALLPKYGGKGMYGMNVHRAVIASGDPETGVSIHVVNSEYDAGPVIAQRVVPVERGMTPEQLFDRVIVEEHALLIETLGRIVRGELDLSPYST